MIQILNIKTSKTELVDIAKAWIAVDSITIKTIFIVVPIVVSPTVRVAVAIILHRWSSITKMHREPRFRSVIASLIALTIISVITLIIVPIKVSISLPIRQIAASDSFMFDP